MLTGEEKVSYRETGFNLPYLSIPIEEEEEKWRLKKKNPKTNLGLLFLSFIFHLHLFFTPAAWCHPLCPHSQEGFSFSLLSLCLLPLLFISPCPSCSLLTANAAPLMGAISSLNTCRCLQWFGRDRKTKRDGDKGRDREKTHQLLFRHFLTWHIDRHRQISLC